MLTTSTEHPEDNELVLKEVLSRRANFVAEVARLVIVVSTIAVVVVLGLWFMYQGYRQLLLVAVGLGINVLSGLLYLVLQRLRRTQIGMILIFGGVLVAVSVCAIALPTLIAPVTAALFCFGCLGYLMFGGQRGHVAVAVSTLIVVVDIILTQTWAPGLFPTALNTIGETSIAVIISAMAIPSLSWMIRLIIVGQEDMLRLARLTALEIGRNMRVVDQQREELETANKEIEARAETEQEQRQSLLNLVEQIQGAAQTLNGATAEIQTTMAQQVAGIVEQNTSITETAATLDEMHTTLAQAAERAEAVAKASRQSLAVSQAGQKAISDAVDGMELIRQRVEGIAQTILELTKHTQQIGGIVNTVNDLAERSKLLALNASIEASHAGEQGKGFAIVAMEVRKLAEQSHEATMRVREILGEISNATNSAVAVTEEGSQGAKNGMQLVEHAGNVIQELTATIENAAQAAQQIVASSQQQFNGMNQLKSAMLQIQQASDQTTASMEQAARSIQDLTKMADQLSDTVAQHQA